MALKKTILLGGFLVLILGLLVVVLGPDEHQSKLIASAIVQQETPSSRFLMNPAEDLLRHGAFSPPNCPSSQPNRGKGGRICEERPQSHLAISCRMRPRTPQAIRTCLGDPAFKSIEAHFEIAQGRLNSVKLPRKT